MRMQLNDDEYERFRRPVRGQGGFQTLLHRIQSGINPDTKVLEISEEDLEKLIRYSFDYGDGGFQGRTEPAARRA